MVITDGNVDSVADAYTPLVELFLELKSTASGTAD